MKKTLHIISGHSAEGAIKECFKKHEIDDSIFMVNAAFQYAPLFTNETTLNRRKEVLNNFFNITDYYGAGYDYTIEIRNFINYNFNEYERVVIWHGDDVDERILLYLTCSLVKTELYEVDITYIKQHLSNKNIPHVCLCHCSVENIRLLYDRIRPISKEKQMEYATKWYQWSRSDAKLRIMDNDGLIKDVNEDYFDKLLLSYCNDEYTTTARVIGNTFGNCDIRIGDGYLHYRVIQLIKEGRLSARTNPQLSTEIEPSNQQNVQGGTVLNGVDATF